MTWRRFLLYAALVALGLALLAHSGQFEQLLVQLKMARWYILGLVLVAQAFSYYCSAKYYQGFFRILGYKVELSRLYQAALAINSLTSFFPLAASRELLTCRAR